MTEVDTFRGWLRRAHETFTEANTSEHTTITMQGDGGHASTTLAFDSAGFFKWVTIETDDE